MDTQATLCNKFVIGIRGGNSGKNDWCSHYSFGGRWALLLGFVLLEGCGTPIKSAIGLLEDTGRSAADKITSKAALFVDADVGKQLTVKAFVDGSEIWSREDRLSSDRKVDLSKTDIRGRSLPVDGKEPITIEIKYRNVEDDNENIGSITFTYDQVAPVPLSKNAWSAPEDYNVDGYTLLIGEGKGETEKENYSILEDGLLVQLVRVTEKAGEIDDVEGEVIAERLFERSSRERNGFTAEGETEKEGDTEIFQKTYYDIRFTGVLGDRAELEEFYLYKIRLVDKAGNISDDSPSDAGLPFPKPPAAASLEGESPDSTIFLDADIAGLSYALVAPFDERLMVRKQEDGTFVLEGSLEGIGSVYYLKGDNLNKAKVLSGGQEQQVLLGENSESDFQFALDEWSDGDRLWVVGDIDGSKGLLVVE